MSTAVAGTTARVTFAQVPQSPYSLDPAPEVEPAPERMTLEFLPAPAEFAAAGADDEVDAVARNAFNPLTPEYP